MLQLPPPNNDDVDRLARVVDALVAGDDLVAEAELAPIAGQTRLTRPIEALPSLRRSRVRTGTGETTSSPKLVVKTRIFARDGFTCVYCGRRTILPGVLRLLSERFKVEFPYQDNWQGPNVHRAYWDISASLEHVEAVSAGGSWVDPDNLATVCYRCQQQKLAQHLDDLGWSPVARRSGWDGLAGQYRPLWCALGKPRPGYHRPYIRAVEDAIRR